MQAQAIKTARTLAAMVAALAMFLSGPIEAKDKEYQEGTIRAYERLEHKWYDAGSDCHDGSSGQCDHFIVAIQIEDLTYYADYEHHRGLVGMREYKFKEEDWPVNGSVSLRFEVKHLLGLRRTFMFIKSPKGQEIRFVLLSKIGADGKELCGKYRC